MLARADESRFSGLFSDSKRTTGSRLSGWIAGGQAKLGDRAILDPANPAKWIRRESVAASTSPTAFVEMVGGDLLPGRVTEWGDTSDIAHGELPTHVVVEPEIALDGPDNGNRGQVRVLTRWIRRIVWDRRAKDQFVPGTVFYRDGRQVAFQAARFSDGAVSILTASERKQISFDEIAELHLPSTNAWDAYFEQLAAITPDCSARLVRLTSSDGLVATTAVERLLPVAKPGGGSADEKSLQAFRPAWAIDPLYVRVARVQSWLFFAPQEIPLSLLQPAKVEQRSTVSAGLRPRIDQNVQGGMLESGGQTFGWGFGVQSRNELYFDLPAAVQGFRTQFGLDQSVGRGGCVRGLIFANAPTGEPIHKTRQMIGAGETVDSGLLSLGGPESGNKQLVLVVDSAHDDRPAGADPFDIRDLANWLEPQLQLDLTKLKAEVSKRIARGYPGLEGWTIQSPDLAAMRFATRWSSPELETRRLRHEWNSTLPHMSLTRTMRVGPQQQWLLVYVSRSGDPAGGIGARVQVRINGRAVQEFDVPARNGAANASPLPVPVDVFRDQAIKVEVVLMPANDKAMIEWSSALLVERLPGLIEVLDDAPHAPMQLVAALDPIEMTSTDKYTTSSALLVKRENGRVTLDLPTPAIRENPQVGQFRWMRFAWKKRAGDQIAIEARAQLGIAKGGRRPRRELLKEQTLRYHAGPAQPKELDFRAVRVGDKVPQDWTVVDVDLFNDLRGPAQLNELSFFSEDNEPVLIDHIYLARTRIDLDRCPKPGESGKTQSGPPADKNVQAETKDRDRFRLVFGELLPQFSLTGTEVELQRLHEFGGRKNVVRFAALKPHSDILLRAPVELSAGKSSQLKFSVSQRKALGNCNVRVTINGESMLDQTIGRDATMDQWSDVSVDLGKFSGQKVIVELLARVHSGEPDVICLTGPTIE